MAVTGQNEDDETAVAAEEEEEEEPDVSRSNVQVS